MAFTYKNPLEQTINQLPTKYSDQILSESTDTLLNKIEDLNLLFSYKVTKEVEEFLCSRGIELAPLSLHSHTHPACKMIESHILYRVLPQMLNKTPSIALMSMRDEKEGKFIKRRNMSKYGQIVSLPAVNSCIDSKDRFRYSSPEELPKDHSESMDKLWAECQTAGWFPKVLLMHDELHFWEPSEIIDFFDRFVEIECLVATIVFPIEILLGEKESKNPRLYTFEVDGDILHFFPDGYVSEGYSQSINNSSWPIRFSSLQRGQTNLRVSILFSLGAHHLISIDRRGQGQSTAFFEKPTCLLKSELDMIAAGHGMSMVERATMSSILLYLSCLKTPNRESAMAKLRQTEKRELFPDEAFLVSSISSTFLKFNFSKDLDSGILANFKHFIKTNLPTFVFDWLDHNGSWSNRFREFMRTIADKKIKIKREIWKPSLIDRVVSSSAGPQKKEKTKSNDIGLFLALAALHKAFKDNKEKGRISNSTATPAPRTEETPIVTPTTERGESSNSEIETQETEPVDEFHLETRETFSANGAVISSAMNVDSFIKARRFRNGRKNDCVFKAFDSFLSMGVIEMIDHVFNCDIDPELYDAIEEDQPLTIDMIQEVAIILDVCCYVVLNGNVRKLNLNGTHRVGIALSRGHAEPMERKKLAQLLLDDQPMQLENPMNRLTDIPNVNKSRVKLDFEAARKLVKSMKRGATGILSEISKDGVLFLDSLEKCIVEMRQELNNMEIQVFSFWGVAGSGKSKAMTNMLRANPTWASLIISPRRFLADDWTSEMKGTAHKVTTFESAIMDRSINIKSLIIDEITLLPPGYLSLIFIINMLNKNRCIRGDEIANHKIKRMCRESSVETSPIFTIGDMTQTFYYNEMDSNLLKKKSDSFDIISGCEEPLHYLWYSYRVPKVLQQIFPFKCLGLDDVSPPRFLADFSVVNIREYDAILVASHVDKATMSAPIGPLTFGEAQGLTFEKRVLIGISDHSLLVGLNGWIVATTRSKRGYDLVMLTGKTIEEARKTSKKRPAERFLNNLLIDEKKIDNMITASQIIKVLPSGGLEEKAMNDLFIMPMIQPSHPVEDPVEIELIKEQDVNLKTHLPIQPADPMLIEVFDKMCLKEHREFFHPGKGYSKQFPDNDKGVTGDVMGYPFRFDSIFPKHTAEDDVTFFEGVKKRLTFSNPREERRKFEGVRQYGEKLLRVFLDKLPERFELHGKDIEDGLNSFNDKRAEKNEALWRSHAERSDIDWPLNQVFLFMKSQLCTKEEKMFTTAKAGQTLACFHHAVLFKFGPYLRAIEKAFVRSCGESYYVHSSKNFDALNEFVKGSANLFSGKSIESDYEAFDSSQDELVLAFEVSLLKHVGMCNGFIEDYITLKLNLGCRLGSFAIMRFTGEFCTFLFNTFANMLFTFLKYDIKPSRDRIMFAGDDMASIGPLRLRGDEESKMLKLFKLKAKEEIRELPRFCGWILTPDGIIKSPRLLWARVCLMSQRGLIGGCLDNYFIESRYAYMLGERLFQYLSESDIEYHYVLTRFFVKNQSKLTGFARQSAYGQDFKFGGKCQSSGLMTLPFVLKLLKLRLGRCNLQKYMGMLVSCIRKFLTAFAALKVMSRLKGVVMRISACRTSRCLMSSKLSTFVASPKITRTYISELSWFVLLPCSQIIEGRKALFTCMMTRLLSLNRVLLPHMKSTSVRAQHFSWSVLSMYFPRLTHFLQGVCTSWLKLMMSSLQRGVRSFPWILGSCTGWLIQAASFLKTMLLGVGLNKKYGAQGTSNLGVMTASLSLGLQNRLSSSLLVALVRSRRGDGSCRLNPPEKDSIRVHFLKIMQRVLGWLGQPHQELIDWVVWSVRRMSIQREIHLVIREAVNQWLWDTYVNTQHVYLPAETNYAALTPDQRNLMVNMLAKYNTPLFGNIAVLGSSSKTVWPNIEINLPNFQIQVGGAQHVFNRRLNLSVVIPALENWRSTHTDPTVSGATFRQICEPFATEASHFLKENFHNGTASNIYKKWPRAFEAAPWIAFDFASGLDFHRLSPDERKVMDRLTKRLFRTENQKGVYDAGKETNVDIEG